MKKEQKIKRIDNMGEVDDEARQVKKIRTLDNINEFEENEDASEELNMKDSSNTNSDEEINMEDNMNNKHCIPEKELDSKDEVILSNNDSKEEEITLEICDKDAGNNVESSESKDVDLKCNKEAAVTCETINEYVTETDDEKNKEQLSDINTIPGDNNEKKTIFKNIFDVKFDKNAPINNIFETQSNTDKGKSVSMFLNNKIPNIEVEDNQNKEISKPDLGEKLLECKCILYKFFSKWENIGGGTLYIYKKEHLRIMFIRDETMRVSFDFYKNFDIKPYIKNIGVGFVIPNGNILLKFVDEKERDAFYDLVK